MDPDTATDVIAAVFALSVQAGMNPDFVDFAVKVGPQGDVDVTSTDSAGAPYQGTVSAKDIADALGMEESSEDPAQESAEKAKAAPAAPPPPAK
jgi:hypothetical protein